MGTSNMNAHVRLWGMWILSILFVVWIVVAWAASASLVLIVGIGFAVAPYPAWWSVAAISIFIAYGSSSFFRWPQPASQSTQDRPTADATTA